MNQYFGDYTIKYAESRDGFRKKYIVFLVESNGRCDVN